MLSNSIHQMLKKYSLRSNSDYENALKEIIQEVALLGLWRAKFFEHALFYGGTALRILHQLNRFSEDLDFSLIKPDLSFDFSAYYKAIELELSSQGFDLSVTSKTKVTKSQIESAFIKGNTLQHLLMINAQAKTHPDALLKIKVEIDKDPPMGFATEVIYHLSPIPFSIKTMTLPSLFAGKLHALLFRKQTLNVKGRDWYDLIWYLKNEVPANLTHLKERMLQSADLQSGDNFDEKILQEMLAAKIKATDFDIARKDISPFLSDTTERASLELWSSEFFLALVLSNLKTVDFE